MKLYIQGVLGLGNFDTGDLHGGVHAVCRGLRLWSNRQSHVFLVSMHGSGGGSSLTNI